MADQEQEKQGLAPARTASIVTGTKTVKVGGKDIRVPVTVEIAKESDLKPELLCGEGGNRKPRYGPRNVKCYITVDGQRLTFDAKGNLL